MVRARFTRPLLSLLVGQQTPDGKPIVVRTDSFFGDSLDFDSASIAPVAIVCCYNSFEDLAHQPRGTMVHPTSPQQHVMLIVLVVAGV